MLLVDLINFNFILGVCKLVFRSLLDSNKEV